MERPMIFCRVGWMAHYQGEPGIRRGGSYVEKHGEGWEMWNFKPEGDGNFYGYVPARGRTIWVERIGGDDVSIDGVDVVFVSTKDGGGTFIVGWYLNATVYRKLVYGGVPHNSKDRVGTGYNLQTSSGNKTCVPESKRSHQVRTGGKGWMGQTSVWYGDCLNSEKLKKGELTVEEAAEISRYVDSVRKYIANYPQGTTP